MPRPHTHKESRTFGNVTFPRGPSATRIPQTVLALGASLPCNEVILLVAFWPSSQGPYGGIVRGHHNNVTQIYHNISTPLFAFVTGTLWWDPICTKSCWPPFGLRHWDPMVGPQRLHNTDCTTQIAPHVLHHKYSTIEIAQPIAQ